MKSTNPAGLTAQRPKTISRQGQGTSPQDFFEQACQSFRQAEQTRGSNHRNFSVAGHQLCVQFAGDQLLQPLTRALDHLRDSDDKAADLTIMAWASSEPGEMPPPPNWTEAAVGAHGVIPSLTDQRFRATWMHQAGGLQMLDLESSRAIFWLRDAAHLPYWENGAPMRNLLDAWFAARGIHLVHAAAVGDRRGVVLLAGRGGSGKSSTALRSLQSELGYLSDDYVLIDSSDWRVYSLYNSGKVDESGLQHLAFLKRHLVNANSLDKEKALLFVHEAFPHKVLNGPLPIRAIVLPGIEKGMKTELVPASQSAALKALAPSTLLQSSSRSAGALRAMACLVRERPAFRLVLGHDSRTGKTANIEMLSSLLGEDDRGARPLISVIIPAYNPGKYLYSALSSIVSQDAATRAGELEVIIVDDGSDDDIASVVALFCNQLDIRLTRQAQQGPSAARNRGIEQARGDLLAFLDADDVWAAGALNALLSAMEENPEADVIQGRLRNLVEKKSNGQHQTCFGPPRLSFNVGSMLFRRRVFDRAGLLNETMHYSEDVDLLVRIRESKLNRQLIDDVCLYYRRHGGGITGPMKPGESGHAHLKSWARILKQSLDRRRDQDVRRKTVTAVIVVKNGEQFIGDALSSVQQQTHPVDQIIVVDGSSDDGTAEIVAGFDQVELIQQPGEGLADARNAGIAAADSEWIAFLDHDDLWPADKLKLQFHALARNPDAEYSLARLQFFADEHTQLPPGYTLEKLKNSQAGPTPGTLLVRRELFKRTGLFDTRFTIGCDLEWIKRVREFEIPYADCGDVLLHKRIHGANLSNRADTNRSEIFRILRASLTNRAV